MTKASEHTTEDVVIEKAKIDKLLVPIIKWLNNYDDVRTQFCCEGRKRFKPYIIFYCFNNLVLCTILATIRPYANVEVEFYAGSLRYRIIFRNKKAIKDFLKNNPEFKAVHYIHIN